MRNCAFSWSHLYKTRSWSRFPPLLTHRPPAVQPKPFPVLWDPAACLGSWFSLISKAALLSYACAREQTSMLRWGQWNPSAPEPHQVWFSLLFYSSLLDFTSYSCTFGSRQQWGEWQHPPSSSAFLILKLLCLSFPLQSFWDPWPLLVLPDWSHCFLLDTLWSFPPAHTHSLQGAEASSSLCMRLWHRCGSRGELSHCVTKLRSEGCFNSHLIPVCEAPCDLKTGKLLGNQFGLFWCPCLHWNSLIPPIWD